MLSCLWVEKNKYLADDFQSFIVRNILIELWYLIPTNCSITHYVTSSCCQTFISFAIYLCSCFILVGSLLSSSVGFSCHTMHGIMWLRVLESQPGMWKLLMWFFFFFFFNFQDMLSLLAAFTWLLNPINFLGPSLRQAYICNNVVYCRNFHISLCWHRCFGHWEVEAQQIKVLYIHSICAIVLLQWKFLQ